MFVKLFAFLSLFLWVYYVIFTCFTFSCHFLVRFIAYFRVYVFPRILYCFVISVGLRGCHVFPLVPGSLVCRAVLCSVG